MKTNALLLLCILFLGSASPAQKYLLHGKYSLYIEEIDEGLEVNWISAATEPGVVAVEQNEKEVARFEGEVSILHKVRIPKYSSDFTISFGNGVEMDRLSIQTNVKKPPSVIKKVDSLYILGDVHGNFNETTRILQNTGLINEELHWTGGTKHLVFVGDVLDRGQDAIRLIWLVYELEQEAKVAGGAVHMVLGNHEIMVMHGDLRYVKPKELQIATMYQIPYDQLFNPQRTLIGQWLITKPVILKVDKVLFAHGGVITNYGNFNIRAINDSVRKFMQEPIFTQLRNDDVDSMRYNVHKIEERKGFFYDSYGPLWFRGYVLSDTLEAYLDHIHQQFGTSIHVVGHTVIPHIESRYGGKLIATNQEYFGSEMVLLVRNKKKYDRFVIDLEGNYERLPE